MLPGPAQYGPQYDKGRDWTPKNRLVVVKGSVEETKTGVEPLRVRKKKEMSEWKVLEGGVE